MSASHKSRPGWRHRACPRHPCNTVAHEAGWLQLLDKIAEMAERLRPGDEALTQQFIAARDWAELDALRQAPDCSRAEVIAMVWSESPERAVELLAECRFEGAA
jgi:hypothetical protein